MAKIKTYKDFIGESGIQYPAPNGGGCYTSEPNYISQVTSSKASVIIMYYERYETFTVFGYDDISELAATFREKFDSPRMKRKTDETFDEKHGKDMEAIDALPAGGSYVFSSDNLMGNPKMFVFKIK